MEEVEAFGAVASLGSLAKPGLQPDAYLPKWALCRPTTVQLQQTQLQRTAEEGMRKKSTKKRRDSRFT